MTALCVFPDSQVESVFLYLNKERKPGLKPRKNVRNRMELDFTGKKVLVTGAGRGFGRDLVKALVKEGAHVFALSRTQSSLDSLKEECPNIVPICADLVELDKALECVKPHLPMDMLVNNAGVTIFQNFLDTTQQAYDTIMDINLKAPYFLSKLVAQSMVDNNIKGSIVHLSSRSSKTAIANAGLHVYSVSKAGLDMLGKNMAVALGPHGIRVNCVNPTLVMTDMGKKVANNEPERMKTFKSSIPLRDIPEVEDVVNAVLFLLSDKSAMTTGATFPVDAGLWAQ